MTPSKIKTIALIASYAPSLVIFRQQLIKDLVAAGHNVIAMAPDIDLETSQKLEALGAVPVNYPLSRLGLNLFHDLKSYGSLKLLLKKRKVDVVLSYTIKPVIWGILAANAAGVTRSVAMITGLGYTFIESGSIKQKIIKKIAILLYKFALKRAHHVIFQNGDDQQLFFKLRLLTNDTSTSVVNGSGIDIQKFTPKPIPRVPVFLMICRLLNNKGVREYAAAATLVKKAIPNATVRIAGFYDNGRDGISQCDMKHFIDGGLDYIGPLKDVRDTIASASIFVLPSYREGTSRTVLEAMAMGRPIITTDVPGCRQTVEDGKNGFLVPAKNITELAEKMIYLGNNYNLVTSMGMESRTIAERRYDVRDVNREIITALKLTK